MSVGKGLKLSGYREYFIINEIDQRRSLQILENSRITIFRNYFYFPSKQLCIRLALLMSPQVSRVRPHSKPKSLVLEWDLDSLNNSIPHHPRYDVCPKMASFPATTFLPCVFNFSLLQEFVPPVNSGGSSELPQQLLSREPAPRDDGFQQQRSVSLQDVGGGGGWGFVRQENGVV